jgi:hypothetical protein
MTMTDSLITSDSDDDGRESTALSPGQTDYLDPIIADQIDETCGVYRVRRLVPADDDAVGGRKWGICGSPDRPQERP